jgi:hypothetical protein
MVSIEPPRHHLSGFNFPPVGCGAVVWAIARRLKGFKKLRSDMAPQGKEPSRQALAVAAIPFPEKVEALVGKDTPEASQTRQMKDQLQAWMNAVIGLAPGNDQVITFLARDSSVRATFQRDVLGLSVSAAELAADKDSRRAGEAFEEAMKATKISDVDAQPERIVITATECKMGDEARKTQTETYTIYRVRVFAPDGEEWDLEFRFSEFKTLRKNLLTDGNPAVKSIDFPSSERFGSLKGEGLDAGVIEHRKDMLEPWLNELLMILPGNKDLMDFLKNPAALPPPKVRLQLWQSGP